MEYIFGFILTWLISYIIYCNFKSRRKQNKVDSDSEFNWNPKPLVDETQYDNLKESKVSPIVINSEVGKWVEVDGIRLLNFASHNYLGLIENEYIRNQAKHSIRKYGVGSCGPRGFYGTVDVHLELEARLAKFLQTESAIVYSYGFSTIASAIAAYCKKNDIAFMDEKVNFSIQRGVQASRCKTAYFKHNDVHHFEELLKLCDTKLNKNMNKFLIVEGLYINSGKICPLSQLIDVCRKYKVRIFIDESISFGVLGKTGRGIIEHFQANIEDIDLIMASMEYALGTGGGFCAGSSFIVEHQRLSSLGYCFSASLPPFLAVAARAGMDIIEQHDELISKLATRCIQLHEVLENSLRLQNYFIIEGDAISPIKHLILKTKSSFSTYEQKLNILDDIVTRCRYRGILIVAANYLIHKEHAIPPASIRLTISVTIEYDEILQLIKILEDVATEVLD